MKTKKDIIENSASPKWGLFEQSFWKHPIRWLKDFKIYRDRIKYFKKYGYSPQAEWETFNWFIAAMKNILTHYRYKRIGTCYVLDEPYECTQEQDSKNELFFDVELDKMRILLDMMNEDNYEDNTTEDAVEKKHKSRDEFFKMFAKYFYSLWD